MTQPSRSHDFFSIFSNQQIIRDFGHYSLSFPCDPRDLRSLARGFQLLFWADFLLVISILVTAGSIFLFWNNSESFRSLCQNMTPESYAAIQAMPYAEQQVFFQEHFSPEEIPQTLYWGVWGIMCGLILNMAGSIFCMFCPDRVVPKAWSFSAVWFVAFFLSLLFPGMAPLFLLLAWQFWLGFLFRLSLLLGQNEAVASLKKVHQSVFFAMMAFLGIWLLPQILKEPQAAALGVSCGWIAVAGSFVWGFLCYAKVLKFLRLSIRQMTWYWEHGNDDLMKERTSGV